MRSEQSWSLLDPKPVLLYISGCDDYIVYWNGIVMPHTMALCMAMEHACGIYPTPEMKTSLEKTYERLYYSNAFDTRAWDDKVASGPLYPYLKRIMNDHIKTLAEKYDASQMLAWFNYERARK
jgi:hypothetical protein